MVSVAYRRFLSHPRTTERKKDHAIARDFSTRDYSELGKFVVSHDTRGASHQSRKQFQQQAVGSSTCSTGVWPSRHNCSVNAWPLGYKIWNVHDSDDVPRFQHVLFNLSAISQRPVQFLLVRVAYHLRKMRQTHRNGPKRRSLLTLAER